MPTLVLTPRFTPDAQALWQAAVRKGWDIERLERWEVPASMRNISDPVLYLEGLFGPTLAEAFGLRLLEPPLDWLPRLPVQYRKRDVRLLTLGEARRLDRPAFMKPPNDKSFVARVCTGADLPTEFDASTPVLVSDVVDWEVEFRCFVLDRNIRALSVYLRNGELQRPNDFHHAPAEETRLREFVGDLLADPQVEIPRAIALDVGVVRNRGWAVVEANAAWGSGIYGCDPEQVLEVLRFAADPLVP